MATIYDVASLAGVSIGTVSHVLNETRFVSDETRGKVLEAITALNYRPSSLARAMVRQETRTIGLIVPDNVNPFFAEIAQGIEDHGFEAGYNVILCNANRRTTKEVAYIDMLISKRVDGVVYMTTDTAQERLRPFQASGIPVVAFDRTYDQADAILLDNFQGGYDAARHLLDLGHLRIGCIAGPDSVGGSNARVCGWQRALEEAYLADLSATTVQARDWSYQSGKEAAAQMMLSGPAPTAIFACNDTLAIGAMSWLQEHGLRLPGDVSIIGYDNIRLSAFTSPPLTTMATPIVQLGTQLCQMLLDRITGKLPPEPQREIVYSQLLVRASTTPPT